MCLRQKYKKIGSILIKFKNYQFFILLDFTIKNAQSIILGYKKWLYYRLNKLASQKRIHNICLVQKTFLKSALKSILLVFQYINVR